jgi:LSD1 subclass zinc finger protein
MTPAGDILAEYGPQANSHLRVQLKDIIDWALVDSPYRNSDQPLEQYNENVDQGVGNGQYPTFRMTGLAIKIRMVYSNSRAFNMGPADRNVDVHMTATLDNPDAPGWASVGPRTFYIDYPTGSPGSQYSHRVIQYPQDIILDFIPSGRAYAFDVVALVQAIIQAVVLMGVVKTLFDIIVFNMLPGGISLVLNNKRCETTSRNRAFAELGMKAAVSVNQFHKLDKNNRGTLDIPDLVRVFGGVEHVDEKKALMIAKTVFQLADKDKQGINFNEFMSLTEGDAIQFETYLNYIHRTGGNLAKLNLAEREAAIKAYKDEEEAVQGIRLGDDDADEPPQAAPTAPAAPAQPAMPQQVQQVVVQQPPTPQLPPGVMKVMCYNCKRPFGVPVGAAAVQCPHCRTVNKLR